MADLHYVETRTDDGTSVTSEPEAGFPRFRTCPLCKQIKPEVEVSRQIYVDGESTHACSLCYAVHRKNPYAGLLYE